MHLCSDSKPGGGSSSSIGDRSVDGTLPLRCRPICLECRRAKGRVHERGPARSRKLHLKRVETASTGAEGGIEVKARRQTCFVGQRRWAFVWANFRAGNLRVPKGSREPRADEN